MGASVARCGTALKIYINSHRFDDRCKCSLLNLYLNVHINRRSSKPVKSFYLTGAAAFDKVLHWVWRELFLSLLASGTERQKKHIPEMLGEIEKMMGWRGLERLLYGGQRRTPNSFFFLFVSALRD